MRWSAGEKTIRVSERAAGLSANSGAADRTRAKETRNRRFSCWTLIGWLGTAPVQAKIPKPKTFGLEGRLLRRRMDAVLLGDGDELLLGVVRLAEAGADLVDFGHVGVLARKSMRAT